MCGEDNYCHTVGEDLVVDVIDETVVSDEGVPVSCIDSRYCGCTASPVLACSLTGANAPLPSVSMEYADYARTLCRELNACGDGDEPLCMDATSELFANCQELGCCSVIDIPF